MSELSRHVDDYLRLRRALGFKLAREGQVLPQLVAYLEAAGSRHLSDELALAWAQLPQGVAPINWSHRLGMARGFATYLKTIDPATEVPARDALSSRAPRPTPYLWSAGDIARLMEAARGLQPPLKAATVGCLLGLIAATGLRNSEARHLSRQDVDLDAGVLTVRWSKGNYTRLVPLHPTTVQALRSYIATRDQLCPTPRSDAFFLTHIGGAVASGYLGNAFIDLTAATGLRSANLRPRVHDLRHSFAVNCLIDWHRSGVDIDGAMPMLSTYLGHVSPAGTYWYLSACPELMELAARRLGDHQGVRP